MSCGFISRCPLLDSPLSRRIVPPMVLLSTLLACIITAAELWHHYRSGVAEISLRHQQVFDALSAAVSRSVWTIDADQTLLLIKGLGNWYDIDLVLVHRADLSRIEVGISTGELHHAIVSERELRYTSADITHHLGSWQLVSSTAPVMAEVREQFLVTLFLNACKTLAVTVFALLLFRHAVSQHLRLIARQLQEVNLSAKPPPLMRLRDRGEVADGDEIQLIVDAINGLRARLSQSQELLSAEQAKLQSELEKQKNELALAHRRLINQDRLSTMGTMVGMMAHEIRNPLGTMQATNMLIRARFKTTPQLLPLLKRFDKSLGRCNDLIEQLKDLVLGRSPELQPLEMGAWMREFRAQRRSFGSAELDYKIIDEPLWTLADSDKLAQIVGNLLRNAQQATALSAHKQAIEIRLNRFAATAAVTIVDHGIGISEADLERLFDPLYSTKTNGFGMGLTVSQKLAETMHGSVSLTPAIPRGAIAQLRLPLLAPPTQPS